MPGHWSCHCYAPSRRAFSRLLLGGAAGAAGVLASPAAEAQIAECKRSGFTKAVSAEQVEGSAAQQYRGLLQKAANEQRLASTDEPQLQRLRYIAQRIVPFTPECNERARGWRWEVNLFANASINAFCMPGGKIAFFYGILAQLQLDDDEVAVIMGHEVAHALLEHAREQHGKNVVTTGGLRALAAILGLGQLGDLGAQGVSALASLKFSRDDETEADRLGLLLAARAGYDPRKGVSLWQKMMGAGGSKPPGWLSTHPASTDRVRDIQAKLPQVLPQFQGAAKPDRRFGPPALPPQRRP